MFEGIKDMGKMLKKAKEMKSEMKKVQNELKDLIIEGKKNGVCVKVSGELECVEVSFENVTLSKYFLWIAHNYLVQNYS